MHLLLAAVLIAGPASAKKIVVDGITTTKAEYDYMVGQVSGPAKFQLDCQEITITVLAKATPKSKWLRTVGVTGCGRRAIYVKIPSTGQWIANAGSDESATPDKASTSDGTPSANGSEAADRAGQEHVPEAKE